MKQRKRKKIYRLKNKTMANIQQVIIRTITTWVKK